MNYIQHKLFLGLIVSGALQLSTGNVSAAEAEGSVPEIAVEQSFTLWKNFQFGMSIPEVSTVLSGMESSKKFKINDKAKPEPDNGILPPNTKFPFQISGFFNSDKYTKVLGYPVIFRLGFSSDNKLTSIVLYPKIFGGIACQGYNNLNLSEGKAFWSQALQEKYPVLGSVYKSTSTFSDDNVTVALDFEFRKSATPNPNGGMGEIAKCFEDTFQPVITYNSRKIFEGNYNKKIENFSGKIDRDL
jgi:hypothetical protein